MLRWGGQNCFKNRNIVRIYGVAIDTNVVSYVLLQHVTFNISCQPYLFFLLFFFGSHVTKNKMGAKQKLHVLEFPYGKKINLQS